MTRCFGNQTIWGVGIVKSRFYFQIGALGPSLTWSCQIHTLDLPWVSKGMMFGNDNKTTPSPMRVLSQSKILRRQGFVQMICLILKGCRRFFSNNENDLVKMYFLLKMVSFHCHVTLPEYYLYIYNYIYNYFYAKCVYIIFVFYMYIYIYNFIHASHPIFLFTH